MKLYLITLLVLLSFLTYKAQGIRLGKVDLSASNHQDIIKISLDKGSIQDDQLLAKSAEFSSGTHRKLMTKITSPTTILKNQKNGEKKHDPKPMVKAAHQIEGKDETLQESSKQWRKDVKAEQYVEEIEIAEMDYTPARKKSPIHN